MSGAVSAGAPPSATPEMLGLPVAAWLQRAHEVMPPRPTCSTG